MLNNVVTIFTIYLYAFVYFARRIHRGLIGLNAVFPTLERTVSSFIEIEHNVHFDDRRIHLIERMRINTIKNIWNDDESDTLGLSTM